MATNPNFDRPTLRLNLGPTQKPQDARFLPSGTPIAVSAAKPASIAASPPGPGDSAPGKATSTGAASAPPPKQKKPPDLDFATGPEQNFLGWAKRRKFPVRFTCLDGSTVEGIVVDRDRFTISLQGERVIFKHAIRDMQASPVNDAPSPAVSVEDTAKNASG
ncbi:MAG TPA: RNA chaperone Hfq [Methylocella sp.]